MEYDAQVFKMKANKKARNVWMALSLILSLSYTSDTAKGLQPVRARKITAAVACAPLMPSGWLWVTSAVNFAISSVLSSVSNSQPAADTRIAEPLPKLP